MTGKLSLNSERPHLSCAPKCKRLYKVETLIKAALSHLNEPYIWGGDDPIIGFDCSGLVQDILASVGQDPPGDQTAQALFDYFSKSGRVHGPHESLSDVEALGALPFFGSAPDKITHVGFIVANAPLRMIEAGGGGSRTKSIQDAARQNAFVRIRPVFNRKDLIAVIRPHYLMMRGRY